MPIGGSGRAPTSRSRLSRLTARRACQPDARRLARPTGAGIRENSANTARIAGSDAGLTVDDLGGGQVHVVLS